MTTGSGLYLNSAEKEPYKIAAVVRQLIEGRANNVGTVTLTHDGAATTTAVSAAVTCGPNSAVFLFPTTAHAAAVVATTYVSSVGLGTFTITHAATSNADVTYYFACIG